MAEYIPSKQSIPHAKELILERIKLEENCIEKPFDTAEIYALQKAALVMDAYEQGYLVERKNGKWIDIPDDHLGITYQCSSCNENTYSAKQYDIKGNEYVFEFCPHCGADMR